MPLKIMVVTSERESEEWSGVVVSLRVPKAVVLPNKAGKVIDTLLCGCQA